MSQFACLIVTSAPETETVQGNRRDDIRIVDKIPPGTFQPAAETRHQVETVGMFQGQDWALAVFVIAHNGARSVERRRFRITGRA